MNHYILVEGKQTERRLYPEWLKHLATHPSQVRAPADVVTNAYHKNKPGQAAEPGYVERLRERTTQTTHLRTLHSFFALAASL
jgi:hypothetical protein